MNFHYVLSSILANHDVFSLTDFLRSAFFIIIIIHFAEGFSTILWLFIKRNINDGASQRISGSRRSSIYQSHENILVHFSLYASRCFFLVVGSSWFLRDLFKDSYVLGANSITLMVHLLETWKFCFQVPKENFTGTLKVSVEFS
jgi:hypothetical protein